MKSKPASSRRESLLARCRTLVWALTHPLRGRSSGATLVEYLIVTGFISLVAIGVFNKYGVNVNKSFKVEAKLIEGEGLPSAGELLSGLGDVTGGPSCGINDRNNPFCVGGNCFAEGTPVAAEGGDRPIESIRLGDRVWARDVETGLVALRPVTKLFVRPDVATIDMEVSAGSHSEHLTVTPGHRFWVKGQGWIPAQDLERSPLASLQESLLAIPVSGVPPPEQGQLGTTLLASGAAESLWATPRSSGTTATTVYNLEVEGFHSYFVGHLHALVHNQNGFPDPLNCPLPPLGPGGPLGLGPGGGTGGSSSGLGPGGGSAGTAGASPPVDSLTPCYKGDATTIEQGDLPADRQQQIAKDAEARNNPDSSTQAKRDASNDAGETAAKGYTDKNFPPSDGWTCESYTGRSTFDRVCIQRNSKDEIVGAVIVEAKGGGSQLQDRDSADGKSRVLQGTPEYIDAVVKDLQNSRSKTRNDLGKAVQAALDAKNVRYVEVRQEFDKETGAPLPVKVHEFALDKNSRTKANCIDK